MRSGPVEGSAICEVPADRNAICPSCSQPDATGLCRDRFYENEIRRQNDDGCGGAGRCAGTRCVFHDADGDGFDDSLECEAAERNLPALRLSPGESCGGPRSIIYRARPHPDAPARLAITHVVLYDRDCGELNGHLGDDEAFAITVDLDAAPGPAATVGIMTSAHLGTACQSDSSCQTGPGMSLCATPDARRTVVYSSSRLTNGWLLSADKAAALRAAGLEQVSVSLDFAGEGHDKPRGVPGLFKRIEHGIPKWQDAGLRVVVNTVIMESNLDHVLPIADLTAKWGVHLWYSCYSTLKTDSAGGLVGGRNMDRLRQLIGELLRRKKKGGNIISSDFYLENVVRYFENGGRVGERCTSAGRRFVHVDPWGYVKNSVANASNSVANASNSVANASNSVANASNSAANASNNVANASNNVANASNNVANASNNTVKPESIMRMPQNKPAQNGASC